MKVVSALQWLASPLNWFKDLPPPAGPPLLPAEEAWAAQLAWRRPSQAWAWAACRSRRTSPWSWTPWPSWWESRFSEKRRGNHPRHPYQHNSEIATHQTSAEQVQESFGKIDQQPTNITIPTITYKTCLIDCGIYPTRGPGRPSWRSPGSPPITQIVPFDNCFLEKWLL